MIECILCNKPLQLIFKHQNHDYFKCDNCKIVSTHPYPSKTKLIKHYKNEFLQGNYKFIRTYSKEYNKIYSWFIKEIKSYYSTQNISLKNKSVLDIGCFTGEFLNLMKKEGCNVYGIELQKDAAKIANKKLKSKRVLAKDVASNPFGNKKFDIITMFGLIEHVENPYKLIADSTKKLNKNGILVIQTPNSESLFAILLRKYWPPYTPIEHIHLFSKKSINILLEINKLKVNKYKSHIKILPVSYVYNMLAVFSPELKKLIDNIPIINVNKIRVAMPFYIGEMFLIAEKK